jgi:vanillate O-demethylase ferredoxin subunit
VRIHPRATIPKRDEHATLRSGGLGIRRAASRRLWDNRRVPDHAFIVELKDGSELEVAADQTIMEAIEASGRRVLNSCREGNCGTCETMVLAGEVDHRDEVLDDDEKASNEVMMICVSRAKGERLVLDL